MYILIPGNRKKPKLLWAMDLLLGENCWELRKPITLTIKYVTVYTPICIYTYRDTHTDVHTHCITISLQRAQLLDNTERVDRTSKRLDEGYRIARETG